MAGQLTIDTLKASTGVLATQNGMTGIAKAWLNYGETTLTINNSFNISSVTKNATGDYSVTFTTAMPNTNYVIVGSGGTTGTSFVTIITNAQGNGGSVPATTSGFRYVSSNITAANYDVITVGIAVFGN